MLNSNFFKNFLKINAFIFINFFFVLSRNTSYIKTLYINKGLFHVFVYYSNKIFFCFFKLYYVIFAYICTTFYNFSFVITNFLVFVNMHVDYYIFSSYYVVILSKYELFHDHLMNTMGSVTDLIPNFKNALIYIADELCSVIFDEINVDKLTLDYIFYSEKISLVILINYIILTFIYYFNKQIINFNLFYWIINIHILILTILYFLFYTQNHTFVVFNNFIIENSLFSIKPLNLIFDKLSIEFILVIIVISLFVSVYQIIYIEDTIFKNRFFIQLNWFIISMLLVVLSGNWLLLLLGWEMLGQTSFFLIGFYKNKLSAYKSSIKAFSYNRLSDLFLLISFVISYTHTGNLNINIFGGLSQASNIIGLFLIITSLIKSAQLIFFFWLPDSMEAPIPASALIHSATLVSAGFYLLLRHKLYIENWYINQYTLIIFSTLSMILFSLIASFQSDIKKLLAFSTISNCSFIYLLISLKMYDFALNYFAIHGFLKSISFLSSGFLIKYNNHYQDFRKWNNNTIQLQMLSMFLITNTCLLAVIPISVVYELKTNISLINTNSWFKNSLIITITTFYTINSYNYGLKYLFYFLKNKYNLKKYKNNTIVLKEIKMVTCLLLSYYIFIIIFFFNISYDIKITINLNNFNYIIILILFNMIILKSNVKITKLVSIILITLILYINLFTLI